MSTVSWVANVHSCPSQRPKSRNSPRYATGTVSCSGQPGCPFSSASSDTRCAGSRSHSAATRISACLTAGSSSSMAGSRLRAIASSWAHSITRRRPEAFSADSRPPQPP
ncbi:hypothetical protein [Streptomyces sp. RLA2-12]|uniref:hypothetical protein n=1 Tax=Streptomyces sp. RLA2-12 TaxID=2721242 RepID=UPI00145CD92C|nr:hypothetical protein [Streptomyces sp. RLA2-12]NMI61832.1 hypothetical protein [Streptomyces sp. RLA2-12]